jgi:hypothetical protein
MYLTRVQHVLLVDKGASYHGIGALEFREFLCDNRVLINVFTRVRHVLLVYKSAACASALEFSV